VKEKIIIKIPGNLTPQEEVLHIARELSKKQLQSGIKIKSLGTGSEIKHLETDIKIIREPVEELTITKECSVCSTIFETKKGKSAWTNYGGYQRKVVFCSENCRTNSMKIIPAGRMCLKRSELHNPYKQNK